MRCRSVKEVWTQRRRDAERRTASDEVETLENAESQASKDSSRASVSRLRRKRRQRVVVNTSFEQQQVDGKTEEHFCRRYSGRNRTRVACTDAARPECSR